MPRRGFIARDAKRDKTLEAMIDHAGRDRVFERVRASGYPDAVAPKSVWWSAIQQVMTEDALAKKAEIEAANATP